jgi:hypothetical protein
MSTDFSIKPVGAPATIVVAQPVSEAASNAVQTTLPASQSVTVPEASSGASNDTPQQQSDFVSHQAFFDRAAGSIVYQEINSNTNQVVEQYPDDATLRRRAYFHALDMTKDQPTRPITTDLKA